MFWYRFLFTTQILDDDDEVDLVRTRKTTTHYKQDIQEALLPKTQLLNVKSAMEKLYFSLL